ncbi:MAG: amino acid racemase, partial [Pseudomonadota bacterium]
TNTMHLMADEVQAAVEIPLLHVADAAAVAMKQRQVRRPLLLGTRFTMEQDFYAGRLRNRHGIDVVTPDSAGREAVHEIIYDELCRGIVDEQSRRRVGRLIAEAESAGADGVVFACTEIGMLLSADDVSLPVFDTTELHVGAAVDFALT